MVSGLLQIRQVKRRGTAQNESRGLKWNGRRSKALLQSASTPHLFQIEPGRSRFSTEQDRDNIVRFVDSMPLF
jgi:trimethylamine:corrinoid methyltransferase-like protein